MRTRLLTLFGLIACNLVSAQDTEHYQLGRIQLQKEFTQSTTINPADLARLPYKDLTSAISLWLNGTYSNKQNVAYVIDGITVNDIDTYHINDIEKIVVVQSALAQTSGASAPELLVLVTTKAYKHEGGKPQMTLSAQAGPVFRKKENNSNGNLGFFHQYYGAVTGGSERVKYGASVNYLHDASPASSYGFHYAKTPGMDQLKTNGWISAKLNRTHSIEMHIGYSPQDINLGYRANYSNNSDNYTDVKYKGKQQILSGNINLNSRFSNGIENRFSIAYTDGQTKENNRVESSVAGQLQLSESKTKDIGKNLAISNSFGYFKQTANLTIAPSINVSYQNFDFSYRTGSIPYSSYRSYKDHVVSITPSVDLTYKKIANLTAGWVTDGKFLDKGKLSESIYPFASVAVNLIQKTATNRTGLKVFASVAESFDWADTPYKLSSYEPGFSTGLNPAANHQMYTYHNIRLSSKEKHLNWQLGAQLSLNDDKLKINYNFRRFDADIVFHIYSSNPIVILPGVQTGSVHQIQIQQNIVNTNELNFSSALVVNLINVKGKFDQTSYQTKYELINTGLINRLRYKNWTAGLDLGYLRHKLHDIYPNSIQAFQLQNIYLGRKINLLKSSEIYLGARNIFTTKYGEDRSSIILGINVGL